MTTEKHGLSEVKVWVDGSCLNNGKQNASAAIGIYYGSGDPRNSSSRLLGRKQTNNRAELSALLYVLCTNSCLVSLKVFSDSMYAINCVTLYSDKWKKNGWINSRGDVVESVELIKYILLIIGKRNAAGSTTVFEHVRAHSTDVNNNAADRLANLAAGTIIETDKVKLLRHMGVPF